MKHLILAIAILLASCSKPKPEVTTENKTLYYRIQQVDNDGTVTYSPIRTINIELPTNPATSDDGEDDDDDDDDDCPLPIKFETFTVVKVKNSIYISWEADNEENVACYIVERSFNSKEWSSISNIPPNLNGIYRVIDNL
jgi:hypothetical protein